MGTRVVFIFTLCAAVCLCSSIGSIGGIGDTSGPFSHYLSYVQRILQQFYNETLGSQWKNNTNWLEGHPCDYITKGSAYQWFGVTCTPEFVLDELHLPENDLSGILLPNIFTLDLKVYNLSSNFIFSDAAIFYGFCNVRNSRLVSLDLSNNRLYSTLAGCGEKPVNFGQLETFILANNHFAGTIVQDYLLSSKLKIFDISNNQISGEIFDPSSAVLSSFNVANNQFTGHLPDVKSIFTLAANFSSNKFTGNIPMNWNRTQLISLDVSHNQLTGILPNFLQSLPNFFVDISDNQFWCPLPSWVIEESCLAIDANYVILSEAGNTTDTVPCGNNGNPYCSTASAAIASTPPNGTILINPNSYKCNLWFDFSILNRTTPIHILARDVSVIGNGCVGGSLVLDLSNLQADVIVEGLAVYFWLQAYAPIRISKVFESSTQVGVYFREFSCAHNVVFASSGCILVDNDVQVFLENSALFTNTGLLGTITYLNGGFLSVINSTFTFNLASNGGGILALGNTSVIIDNCIFDSNTGAKGGAISLTLGTLTISDSQFHANLAAMGGALYVDSFDQTIITNSNFTENSATTTYLLDNLPPGFTPSTANGGAIYCSDFQNLTVIDCFFGWNSADLRGGALYADTGDSFFLSSIEFSYNEAVSQAGSVRVSRIESVTITNSDFLEGGAKEYGGGIFAQYNSYFEVSNCVFNGTSAVSKGGAIYLDDNDRSKIENVIFSDSSANVGRSIFCYYENNVTISNCSAALIGSFSLETSEIYGFYSNIDISEFQSSDTSGNLLTFDRCNGSLRDFAWQSVQAHSSLISSIGSFLIIENGILNSCSGDYLISIYDTADNNSLGSIIRNCSIVNALGVSGTVIDFDITNKESGSIDLSNISCIDGQMVCLDLNISHQFFRISNVNITGNMIGLLSTAKFTCSNCTGEITDLYFEQNNAPCLFAEIFSGHLDLENLSFFDNIGLCFQILGHGIEYSSMNLTNSLMQENQAIDHIAFFENLSVAISLLTLSQNSAPEIVYFRNSTGYAQQIDIRYNNGAGVIFRDIPQFTLEHSTFEGNRGFPTTLLIQNSRNTLLNSCLFTSNEAPNGAVFVNASTAVWIASSYFGVNSGLHGGAIGVLSSNLTLDSSEFNANFADSGGGIYAEYSQLQISFSHFTANVAQYAGAGIYSNANMIRINSTTMTDQSCKGSGAAAFSKFSFFEVFDSNFTYGNAFIGGAFATDEGIFRMENSIITNNRAHSEAGGLYFWNSDAVLFSVTLKFNYALYGGAIWSAKNPEFIDLHSHLNISDSVVQQNIGAVLAGGISVSYQVFQSVNVLYCSNEAPTGGAIDLRDSIGSFQGGNFTENSATTGAAIQMDQCSMSISGVGFLRNSAQNSGGALWINGGNVTIDFSDFGSNNSTLGGAMYANQTDIFIQSSEIHDNKAIQGGAMYALLLFLTQDIHNVTFSNNSALNGGVIYCSAETNKSSTGNFNSTLILHDSVLMYNHAQVGGVIFWNMEHLDWEISSDNILENNYAVFYGPIQASIYEDLHFEHDYQLLLGQSLRMIVKLLDQFGQTVKGEFLTGYYVSVYQIEGNSNLLLTQPTAFDINGEVIFESITFIQPQIGILSLSVKCQGQAKEVISKNTAISILPCPPGFCTFDNSSCVMCPLGSYSLDGSKPCTTGEICLPCTNDATCASVDNTTFPSIFTMTILQGFTVDETHDSIIPCVNCGNSSIVTTPIYDPGEIVIYEFSYTIQCLAGGDGTSHLCSKCEKNFIFTGKTCEACPEKLWVSFLIVILILTVLFVLIVVFKGKLLSLVIELTIIILMRLFGFTNMYLLELGAILVVFSFLREEMVSEAVLSSFIFYVQVSNLVLTLAGSLSQSTLNNITSKEFPINCVPGFSWFTYLPQKIFILSLPLLTVIICTAVYFIGAKFQKNKQISNSFDPEVDMSPLITIVRMDEYQAEEEVTSWKGKCFKALCFLLFIFYIDCTSLAVDIIPCQQDGNSSFMIFAPWVECWSSVYIILLIISVLTLICYSFGFIAALYIILFRHRNEMDDETVKADYGFLFESFKPRFYWWCCWNLAKRTLLVMISTLLEFNQVVLGMCILCALLLSVASHSLALPYEKPYENIAETINLLMLMFLFSVTMPALITTDVFPGLKQFIIWVDVLVLIVLGAFILLPGIRIYWNRAKNCNLMHE
jgi:predicted outer membrane repeat protein